MTEGIALGTLLALVGIINLISYLFSTPRTLQSRGQLDQPIRRLSLYKKAAPIVYGLVAVLAILRTPYGLIPYACKLILFVALRGQVRSAWRISKPMQLARTLGDFINYVVTSLLMGIGVALLGGGWLWDALTLVIGAELCRLLFEKGQILISAVWQTLPHRAVAMGLSGRLPDWLQAYRHYYGLPDEDRMALVLSALRAKVCDDPELSRQVSYVRAFRIVPDNHPLEAGDVRDVAAGEVFIHRSWTNDPFLLMGLAVRRGAWVFDPRYLRRPFYYRTESNYLATLAVWHAAPVCPPMALYQFGHEIKAARYAVYFRLSRLIGFNNEKLVLEDGVHPYEHIIGWLDHRLGWNTNSKHRPLWSDTEVIADAAEELTAIEVAKRYTYPLCYVEEVLLGQIKKSPPRKVNSGRAFGG